VGSADGRVEYGDNRCGEALSSKRSGGLVPCQSSLIERDGTTYRINVLIWWSAESVKRVVPSGDL